MVNASSSWVNNIYRSDNLPPTTVNKKTKESKKWQRAMLDSFEHIGLVQLRENLEFLDYYRMVEGDMAYRELAEVIPQLDNIQDLLDGVGIPTFLKHYDILGTIVRAIVGKYIDFQNKYHIRDIGEIAENEYLRHKNEEIQKEIVSIVNNFVDLKLAEMGINPDGQEFSSEEEQQQYLQQLEEERAKLEPRDLKKDKKITYKTAGVRWGEATLDKDKELFNLDNMEKDELKDKILTGRYFRHYRLRFDNYEPERWDPRNTFFSKEVDSKHPQKGEYVGRVHFMTPGEVIRFYGHEIDSKKQKELLGGNESWSNFVGTEGFSGSIGQSLRSNFVKPQRVPFSNFYDYNFALGIQDDLGIPMGNYTSFEKDGTTSATYDSNLSRMMGDTHGRYNFYANVLRSDFRHRNDLCQVTEVYFRAYELYGYLTYEAESGRMVTELVSEDILEDFLKENNITQTFKESIVDIVKDFEPNTLKWFYKPVSYEGVKIQSGNLQAPIYLRCRPCEHQIKGDTDWDVLLPVGGHIGKSEAKKIVPFQETYNLCMNQIVSLLEKELGMFFLMDVQLIPSEFEGQGDAQEALLSLRNAAKDLGIFPIATSGDAQKNSNSFVNFAVHDISHTNQINNRVQLCQVFKNKAYEVIGINPQMFMEPTKYETAEGVRQSAEASFAQISEIYNDFGNSNQKVLELHMSVAQYAQTNKKDISVTYTKSDSSIAFLKLSDPNFPLRRLGLVASEDSQKRKELEEFKAYLMNTNTMGDDTLEIARLIGSDTMSEVLLIAEREREAREERQEIEHRRTMELEEERARIKEEEEQAKWDRTETSKERDRQARKEIEAISAAGRASSKDATEASFDKIENMLDRSLEENSLNLKAEKDLRDFKLKEKQHSDKFNLEMEKLKLAAKQLEQRVRDNETKKYIATVNKN